MQRLALSNPFPPAPVLPASENVWRLPDKETKNETTTGETLPDVAAGRPSKALPETVSQSTFREARNASVSIADGARRRRWREVPGEVALMHAIDGEPLQVKLSAGPLLTGSDSTYEALRDELKRLDARSVLLFQIAVGLSLEERHFTVELDSLIRALGWQPRSRDEREKMRRGIFHWLRVFDSLTVHGRRPEKYIDRMTGTALDLSISGKLIMLSQVIRAEQEGNSDVTEAPVMVTLTAGPFLDRFRKDKRVLQHFGNVRRLAELPTGKPSGAWALSIGLALHQLWRQSASYSQVGYAGDNGHLTVRPKYPFTRFQLLDLFRSEPWVEDVLSGRNPNRARTYWKEAIRLLKQHKVIGHYKELDELPDNRKGWQDFWLHHQMLDLRPKQDGARAIEKLSRTAKKVRRAQARKRSSSPAGRSRSHTTR